jgi:hypothetical protein
MPLLTRFSKPTNELIAAGRPATVPPLTDARTCVTAGAHYKGGSGLIEHLGRLTGAGATVAGDFVIREGTIVPEGAVVTNQEADALPIR